MKCMGTGKTWKRSTFLQSCISFQTNRGTCTNRNRTFFVDFQKKFLGYRTKKTHVVLNKNNDRHSARHDFKIEIVVQVFRNNLEKRIVVFHYFILRFPAIIHPSKSLSSFLRNFLLGRIANSAMFRAKLQISLSDETANSE
jgi:hypothetical protein